MFNVQQITATLAKLPDQQLQQYAQLHKSDPYIMALAMSESNRRKEVRGATKATAQQEQPKVVDQEIAQMVEHPAQPMPEDQGIGQLPAGDMNFAGGGIIAFADGGGVERYQYGGEIPFDPVTGTPMYQQAAQIDEDVPTIRERLGLGNPENRRVLEQVERDEELRKRGPVPVKAPVAEKTVPSADIDRLNEQKAKTRLEDGFGASERPPAMGGLSTIDALQNKYFGGYAGRSAKAEEMNLGLVRGIKDLAASNLSDLQQEFAARGDVYKGQEERISKQEKSLEGMGDKYMGLALLQAGAAMMSTPGGIAAALGKGVTIGADRYASGLEKLNAAQSKLAEARNRLDDLRINREDMNAREIRAAKRDAKSADLKGQELMLNAFEKDWGIERDMVGKVFSAAAEDLKTSKLIGAQERIAGSKNAQDKMNAQVWQAALRENENDPLKARAAILNLEQEGKRDTGIETSKKEIAKKRVEVAASAMPPEMKASQIAGLDALEKDLDRKIAARMGAVSAMIPPAAVQSLRSDPSLAAQFDAKYGKGASAQYLK